MGLIFRPGVLIFSAKLASLRAVLALIGALERTTQGARDKGILDSPDGT